jgi:gamma-glutamyltranspeptidase / glutathione hydrolase / leukotriene-C4 hydrolase
VIDLCRKGHLVSPYLENILRASTKDLLDEPSLSEIFINPSTNLSYMQGNRIKRLKLARTLEVVAREGAAALYGGALGRKMVEDVRTMGGILSEKDLQEYE